AAAPRFATGHGPVRVNGSLGARAAHGGRCPGSPHEATGDAPWRRLGRLALSVGHPGIARAPWNHRRAGIRARFGRGRDCGIRTLRPPRELDALLPRDIPGTGLRAGAGSLALFRVPGQPPSASAGYSRTHAIAPGRHGNSHHWRSVPPVLSFFRPHVAPVAPTALAAD